MNYFTATISSTLAEKLKEKGMPIDCIENFAGTGKDIDLAPSYAKIFDWLMEKGYRIVIHTKPANEPVLWFAYIGTMEPDYCIIADTRDCDTWREAAEAAIEKALELI